MGGRGVLGRMEVVGEVSEGSKHIQGVVVVVDTCPFLASGVCDKSMVVRFNASKGVLRWMSSILCRYPSLNAHRDHSNHHSHQNQFGSQLRGNNT